MRQFPALLLALLLLPLATAVTIDSVTMSPTGNVTTTATLSCLITASGTGTLSANITWYRDNATHVTDNETLSLSNGVEASTSAPGNIEAADTTKGEYWHCQATAGNGTTSAAANSTAILIRNSPPALTNPTTAQTVTEDTLYTLTAAATDADGDPILQFISSDLNASLYGGNALFTIESDGDISFTPGQSAVGNHTMAILPYDGEEFGGQSVLYTVTAVDDPPAFQPALTNTSATTETPFSYTITATDEENDALNFTFSASNPTIILTQSGAASANVSFFSGTPQFTDRGVHEVNVTVYQNASPEKNSTQTFWINVTGPNRPPALDFIANQTGVQGENFTLSVNATDNDTEDTLLFEIAATCGITNPWNITTTVNASNGTGLINLTLGNNHVMCRSATITVRDYEGSIAEGGSDSQVVFFDVTNTNDAPVLQNISVNGTNFQGQTDLRSLTAYTSVAFSYTVNATDIDTLTYAGDTLTYGDNVSLFTINASTGLVSFTPSTGDVGTHLINVTVADSNGSLAYGTMNLTIEANYPPAIQQSIAITCQEDAVCLYNFTATDSDANENLTFTSNSSLINFTQSSYNVSLFNRTFNNSVVGNYTVLVTVTDIAGQTNTTTVTLSVNNTNDVPFFDGNGDGFSDGQSMPGPVVVGRQTEWIINATDVDMRNAVENLSFSAVITVGPNASLFTVQQLNQTQARIRFTPAEADIGGYTLNLTVADLAGLNDSRLVSFTVYNTSLPPSILSVQPFHNGSEQINTSLTATTATNTSVTFPENTSATYNISFTDPDSALANITVRYYRDGSLIHTASAAAPSYNPSYDFFSSGTHTLTVVVEDEYFSNDTFTWSVTVADVNRPPVFTPGLANRTINTTTVLSDEMNNFLDPDDDLDSDGILDSNETSTLTFTLLANSFVNASFDDLDVTLEPVASGVAIVYYTAADAGGLQAVSNNVTYTVFHNPDEESSSSSSSSGGGGGGGAARVPQNIPTPEPYSLELLTPKPITIYVNESVVAPLTLKNTGENMLSGITLQATSESNLTFSFSESQIAQLPTDESRDVTLTINGFRQAGTIEVFVTALVQVPEFNDTAVIYINSLEQKKEGEDAVNLKITYARDFLAENPACGELVQLVSQAEQAYRNGDLQTAEELLSAVTEGCTFLKKQVAEEIQVPSALAALAGYRYINVVLGGVLLLLLVTGALLLVHYGRQQ